MIQFSDLNLAFWELKETEAVIQFSELKYCNDPKFSDKQVCPNSVDPDQTAPDQGLHYLQFHYILWMHYCKEKLIVQILGKCLCG